MNPLADQHLYLAYQSKDQRASDYPYAAPEGAYVLVHGRLLQLSNASVLEGRVAVLSVGSNRAPVQLRRKFGNKAVVPVTPLILHDCDVVHRDIKLEVSIALVGLSCCLLVIESGGRSKLW